MASIQQKVQCVLWHAKFKSIVTIQCNFLCTYRTDIPNDKSITRWFTQLKKGECWEAEINRKTTNISKEIVERIRQSCLRSTKNSITRHSLELSVPKTTVQNVLHNWLRLHAYTIQLKYKIKFTDRKMCRMTYYYISRVSKNFLKNIPEFCSIFMRYYIFRSQKSFSMTLYSKRANEIHYLSL
jgi:hypothetical protein